MEKTQGQQQREETYKNIHKTDTFGVTQKTPYDNPTVYYKYSPYIKTGLKYGLGLLGSYYLGNNLYASHNNNLAYMIAKNKSDALQKLYFG